MGPAMIGLLVTLIISAIFATILRRDMDVYILFNLGVLWLVLAFPFQNGWLAILGIPLVLLGVRMRDRLHWKPYSSLNGHQRRLRKKNLYLLSSLLAMTLILLFFF